MRQSAKNLQMTMDPLGLLAEPQRVFYAHCLWFAHIDEHFEHLWRTVRGRSMLLQGF